jgi:hypothetical protein
MWVLALQSPNPQFSISRIQYFTVFHWKKRPDNIRAEGFRLLQMEGLEVREGWLPARCYLGGCEGFLMFYLCHPIHIGDADGGQDKGRVYYRLPHHGRAGDGGVWHADALCFDKGAQ